MTVEQFSPKSGRVNFNPEVDEAAAIKAQIKKLQSRYEEIKASLSEPGAALSGQEYIAVFRHQTRRTVRLEDAEKFIPAAIFAKIVLTTEIDALFLERLAKIESKKTSAQTTKKAYYFGRNRKRRA